MSAFRLTSLRSWLRGFLLCLPMVSVWGDTFPAGPRRLLIDDYYAKPRDESRYGQGVARGDPELRSLSNFYAPTATAIPNGTFALSQLIRDAYRVEIGREPISAELLADVGAYMMICPIRPEKGGRADLTAADAIVLRDYVAAGGILILVANSVNTYPDVSSTEFNFEGLNRIARHFGMKFAPARTDTISIPIAVDHPYFDGPRDLIFGNGCLIEVLPDTAAKVEVLLESHRREAVGPVAVLSSLGAGKVLCFGDGGTFGNAHAFRSDLDHAAAVRQLMLALLPDGPAPRYGWESGVTLTAEVRQEQIISAYPQYVEFFRLPHAEDTAVYTSSMRELDLDDVSRSALNAENREFVSVVHEDRGTFTLGFQDREGPGFTGQWSSADGDATLAALLLPNGRFKQPTQPTGASVTAWQQVLLHEAVLAPLRAYAEPGSAWDTTLPTGLPQLQLQTLPRIVSADATITFVGQVEREGKACYQFTRHSWVDGTEWKFEDLLDPAAAARISSTQGLELFSGGAAIEATYWISADRLLPVHSEVKVTAAIWWRDPRFPDRYVGRHDSRNYEDWETINLVATYGRVLTVDFLTN